MNAANASARPELEYLQDLAKDLEKRVTSAWKDFKAEDIHKGRVATRRLTCAVKMFGSLIPKRNRKRLLKRLKRVRHALGEHRDMDVALGTLSQLAADDRLVHPAYLLTLRLEEKRDRLRQDRKRPPGTIKGWTDFMACLSAAGMEDVQSLAFDAVHDNFDQVVMRAGDMTEPHRLRIQSKELRYEIELAMEVAGADMDVKREVKKGIDSLKEVQDALGAWHDQAVLAGLCLEAVQGEELILKASTDGELLLDMARACFRRSRKELAVFKGLWPAVEEDLASAVYRGFPASDVKLSDNIKLDGESDPQMDVENAISPETAAIKADTGETASGHGDGGILPGNAP